MKPTINEIKIAKNIVKELVKHDFFEVVTSEYNDNFYDWREKYKNYLKENNLVLCCGETKACIISDKLSNWVIKVGFVGTNEKAGRTTDFCAIEEKNYRDAIKEGLEEFFAASYELCTLTPPKEFHFDGEVTFYIQEWAEPDEDKTSSTCDRYMRDSSDEYDEDNDECCEYEDEDRLESLFRENKKLNELFDFIYRWEINDLHSGNFGYTREGKVKIIDYSGY